MKFFHSTLIVESDIKLLCDNSKIILTSNTIQLLFFLLLSTRQPGI